MISLKYNPKNLNYIFLLGPESELSILDSKLNLIPKYMYLPTYTGMKIPTIFLYKNKPGIRWAYSGLWKTILDQCPNEIEIQSYIDSDFKYFSETQTLSLSAFTEEISKWNLNISPRDYQIHAAYLILKYRQGLFQLATRSGKTLIAYLVFRWLLDHHIVNNCLLVVPSVQLVLQGVEDFKQYGTFFNTEEIWAGKEYCQGSNLTIGTFQSIVKRTNKKDKKYNPNWISKFESICIDEAHHLTSQSVQNILKASVSKIHSWGFTGTLPQEGTIESFCCHSLMGPTIKKITTTYLVKDGWIVPPEIYQIYINHSEEDIIDFYIKKGKSLLKNSINKELENHLSKTDFAKYLSKVLNGPQGLALEQQTAIYGPLHQKCILSLIQKDKNTIIFAHSIKYIQYLKEYLKKYMSLNIFSIQGSTPIKERNKIIEIMNSPSKGNILIASFGCISTGITFSNIDIGIFAQPFKSRIISLQSIGRGLLKNKEKKFFIVYDLIDKIPFSNRLEKHGRERLSSYKEENFSVQKLNFN